MDANITDDGMIRDQLTWKKREMDEEEQERYEVRSDDDFIIQGIGMTSDDTEIDVIEYFPD